MLSLRIQISAMTLFLLTSCSEEENQAIKKDTSSTTDTGSSTQDGTDTDTDTDKGTQDGTDKDTDEGTNDGTDSDDCPPASGESMIRSVELKTSDGKKIAATYAHPTQGKCLPTMMLIHQYQQDQQQWQPWLEQINQRGYASLTLDLRGHGLSDSQNGEKSSILTDPDQAPLDLQSALEFLRQQPEVDPKRIATFGTSIGGNLAVVASSIDPEISVSVALSPRLSAINSLAGMPESLSVSALMCFASDLDSNGAQAKSCQDLLKMATNSNSTVKIFPESSEHGLALLSNHTDTMPSILDWLDINL